MGGGGSPLPPLPPVPGTVTQGLLWHTQDSEPPQCHPLLPAQPPFIYTNGSLQWWGGGEESWGRVPQAVGRGFEPAPLPVVLQRSPRAPLVKHWTCPRHGDATSPIPMPAGTAQPSRSRCPQARTRPGLGGY